MFGPGDKGHQRSEWRTTNYWQRDQSKRTRVSPAPTRVLDIIVAGPPTKIFACQRGVVFGFYPEMNSIRL